MNAFLQKINQYVKRQPVALIIVLLTLIFATAIILVSFSPHGREGEYVDVPIPTPITLPTDMLFPTTVPIDRMTPTTTPQSSNPNLVVVEVEYFNPVGAFVEIAMQSEEEILNVIVVYQDVDSGNIPENHVREVVLGTTYRVSEFTIRGSDLETLVNNCRLIDECLRVDVVMRYPGIDSITRRQMHFTEDMRVAVHTLTEEPEGLFEYMRGRTLFYPHTDPTLGVGYYIATVSTHDILTIQSLPDVLAVVALPAE